MTRRWAARLPGWRQAVLLLILLQGAAVLDAAEPKGGSLVVRDPDRGCPRVTGRFVALADPERGLLLLSASQFPGGQRVAGAAPGPVAIDLPGAASWPVAEVSAGPGALTLWASTVRIPVGASPACLAFNKERFSSEGDLVTYLQWLVGEVYLGLPEQSRPVAFTLGNREVVVWIERPGYRPLRLAGREGATLTFRTEPADRVYLMRPFILERTSGRIGLWTAISDQPYWREEEKASARFFELSGAAPVTFPGTQMTVRLDEITDP
jgi:hypothetical protein